MTEMTKEMYEKSGPRVVEALKKRNFDAYYVSTSQEAAALALSLIPRDHVVSWGGTVTVDQLGIKEKLRQDGYTLIDRDTAKGGDEKVELMRKALTCDTFLMSANAISADGQLVNIDGNGNRVAAMCFGPKSVIVIAGMNKVAKTLEDAWQRARTFAAPARAMSFHGKTPCNVTGQCADCTGTDCCCAYLVTTRVSRPAGKIKVILVGEDLGL